MNGVLFIKSSLKTQKIRRERARLEDGALRGI
jgi:hypothetical protein